MRITSLSYGLLIFIILVASLIVFLIRPEQLTDQAFYLALLWTNFLVGLNWFVSIYFFSEKDLKKKLSTQFGILPSLQTITLVYTIGTLSLLIFFWVQANFQSLPITHWVLQIAIGGLYGVLCFLMFIATKTAELPEIDSDLTSKENLLLCLSNIKQFLLIMNKSSENVNDEIKTIERVINHSIPHLSVLRDKDTYKKFASTLTALSQVNNPEYDYQEDLRKVAILARNCR